MLDGLAIEDPFCEGSTFYYLRSFSYLPSTSEAFTISQTIRRIQGVLCGISDPHPDTLTLRTRLQNYQAILSPIRRVPPELWSRIFINVSDEFEKENYLSLCLTTALNITHSSVRDPSKRHISLRLSAVCSYWRSVALRTPQLWSKIIIDFQQYDIDADARRSKPRLLYVTALLQLWLSRSGVTPLHISLTVKELRLTYKTTKLSLYEQRIHEILDLLWAHSAHWGDVHLVVEDRYISSKPSLLTSLKNNLPLLHTLNLTIPFAEGAIYRWYLSTDAFSNAPNLRRVILPLFPQPQEPSNLAHGDVALRLPFHQLTSLQISRFSPYEAHFYNTLHLLPNLQHLILCYRYTFVEGSIHSNLTTSVLPITTLTLLIDDFNCNTPKTLFPPSPIGTPNLKELRICSKRHSREFSYRLPLYVCAKWDGEAFLEFAERSGTWTGVGAGAGGFQLSKLELSNISMRSEGDFLAVLRAMPTLQWVVVCCTIDFSLGDPDPDSDSTMPLPSGSGGRKGTTKTKTTRRIGTRIFFQHLIYDPLSYETSGVLVPELKGLEVAIDENGGGDGDGFEDVVMEMIMRRKGDGKGKGKTSVSVLGIGRESHQDVSELESETLGRMGLAKGPQHKESEQAPVPQPSVLVTSTSLEHIELFAREVYLSEGFFEVCGGVGGGARSVMRLFRPWFRLSSLPLYM
ncbi:hypothetical protein D9758_013362 [Tetrapyrgos nigripes]|uniref:F-box domain-containing protein n=1 Tax=Tetrapyrgos nigripes TaxID=182062 RepID=A0A8H5CKX0_9AGAR|nr:hypothetical protein D9758_013362 [Tetrapyrgos nigripes]